MLDGTGDYIAITTNDDFGFGQNDFTLEMWIDPNSVTGIQTLFDPRAGIATDITPLSL